MLVLVLEEDADQRHQVARRLKSAGFEVICADRIEMAMELIRGVPVDVLVSGDKIGDRFTLSVALAAEYYNPLVETILLTDGCGPETSEYYDLLPSLHYILGRPATPEKILQFVRLAVDFQTSAFSAPLARGLPAPQQTSVAAA